VAGFDNFLAEPQRLKLSSLRNTVAAHFNHVLLLPGQKIFFLCSAHPINLGIPALLKEKGIETYSIEGFYHGNISPERISSLNSQLNRQAAKNLDEKPHLMAIMFDQWFAKYNTSPIIFIVALAGFVLFYLFRLSREEFVLFSTGAMAMGSEMLVIFAFQIYYGYIYFQIGLIVTVFLAGLLPGAWYGERLRSRGRQMLLLSDCMLIGLLTLLIMALKIGGDLLPVPFYLLFGFMISLICGFQFPVALYLRGGDNQAVARVFSADLIGAGFGTLFTSLALIPYCGLIWAAAGLIGIKCISLLIVVKSAFR
jgi:spermidine synthase